MHLQVHKESHAISVVKGKPCRPETPVVFKGYRRSSPLFIARWKFNSLERACGFRVSRIDRVYRADRAHAALTFQGSMTLSFKVEGVYRASGSTGRMKQWPPRPS